MDISATHTPAPTRMSSPAPTAQEDEGIDLPPIREEIESLRAQYPQIVGTIHYAGAHIDAPVVQAQDNDYYLTHSARQEPDVKGAIFLDAALPGDQLTPHTLIHGHHMRDGSMFGQLDRLIDSDFLSENPIIEYGNQHYAMQWEIFAVCVVDQSTQIPLSFADDAAYSDYIDRLLQAAAYDTGIRPKPGELLLTLNTCTYDFEGAHLLVCARLKDVR